MKKSRELSVQLAPIDKQVKEDQRREEKVLDILREESTKQQKTPSKPPKSDCLQT